MPKIVIREIDNTASPILNTAENVVYIPGLSNNSAKQAPVYYTTVSAFINDAEKYDKDILSYKMAEYCLNNLGLHVIYQGLNNASELTNASTWKVLSDNKNSYPVRFLTTGGFSVTNSSDLFNNTSTSYAHAEMLKCAAKRGDCIGLVDYIDTTGNSDVDYSNVSNIRAYFENVVNNSSYQKDDDSSSYTAGAFGAGFVPNFKTNNEKLYYPKPGDTNNSSDILPASFGYLSAYAKMIVNNPEWQAVAGSERGVIPVLSDLQYVYSEADVEQLQARAAAGEVDLDANDDNVGVAINPITTMRPFGDIIWGNRTLLINTKPNEEAKTGVLKATSFLNVRNLICTIKKALYNASKRHTFDQNGDVLWINFSNEVTPLLERMKSGNGILAYRLDRVKSDAKARLKAKLTIVPVEAVEDFEFDIYLENSLEVSERA